jgi:hypothetical protein
MVENLQLYCVHFEYLNLKGSGSAFAVSDTPSQVVRIVALVLTGREL